MSERLRELERLEELTPEPSPEIADRVWRAVQMQVASGEPALTLKEGPLVAELPARVVSLKLLLGGAVVLLGIVGAGVAAGSRWRAEPEPKASIHASAETEPEAAPSPAREPIAPPSPTVIPDPPPTVEPLPPPVEPKPKAKSEPKPEPPPKPKTLADEAALIQAISKGLKQGEWKSVLSLVAEHERDFANGQFVEERQAAKARAQCRSGAVDAGRKAAESFAKRWPSSIHLATVRQDCGL